MGGGCWNLRSMRPMQELRPDASLYLSSKVLVACWPWPHIEAVGNSIERDIHDSRSICPSGWGQRCPPVWQGG